MSKICKQDLPLKCANSDVFLPDVCQLRSRQLRQFCSRLNMLLFFHQTVANLPQNATAMERILKTFKIWGYFWENVFFSKKNLEYFQNRYMWQIFSRMRLKWYFFSKMSSHFIFDVFWRKSEIN